MNTHTDPSQPEFSGGYDLRPPDCPTAPSAGKILAKSFPVEKLSAAVAGFLISGEALAYRLDSTWKLIDWQRKRMAAVPGSIPFTFTL